MTHEEKAEKLFRSGCNCAQSVLLAFEDLYKIDHDTALKLSSGFGAGIGKLRETCGCVSGMVMAVDLLYGYYDLKDADEKRRVYGMVQELVGKFEKEAGSLLCRELLGLKKGEDPVEPAVRDEAYYQSRPCLGLCRLAARILDNYISEHTR